MISPAAPLWRDLSIAFELPEAAFGAAIDVDDLLVEPDLHFAVGSPTSRLVLMPRLGTFSRLVLEWETLPEIGVFSATSWPADSFTEAEVARLETWMRDVASILHSHRDLVRTTAERAVRDASSGLDRSDPDTVVDGETVTTADDAVARSDRTHVASAHVAAAHVVSAHVGTRAAGPAAGALYPIVDVTGPVSAPSDSAPSDSAPSDPAPSMRELRFVDRASGTVLGRRRAERADAPTAFEPLADDVSTDDLTGWYDEHIVREVLFDDVWQVCVHLLAGLEAPASVVYFS